MIGGTNMFIINTVKFLADRSQSKLFALALLWLMLHQPITMFAESLSPPVVDSQIAGVASIGLQL